MFEVRSGDDGVVKLIGRLDASQTTRAREALRGVEHSLVLDFSELEYISSAGIGVIVETYKRLHGKKLGLKLVRLQPSVRAVFGFAGLESLLAIE